MKQNLRDNGRRFIQAQRAISRAEPLQNMYARPLCAEMFVEKGADPDIPYLKKCESLLVKEEGFFSDFSGISALMIVTTLAVSSDPKKKLKQLQKARSLIRKSFPPIPDYIPLASIILTEVKDEAEWPSTVERAKEVYDSLKRNHRILTSGGDILFSLLLAKSGKSTTEVIEATKQCSERLQDQMKMDPESFRSLCRVLAMNGSSAEESCDRFLTLYQTLREKGYKYGKGYQSPMLALAALLPYEIGEVAQDIIDVDTYLSKKEMYRGIVPKYSKTIRLMHAAMIVAGASNPENNDPEVTVHHDVIVAMEITMWTLFDILFL